jgi:DNA-binding MarR family transcriptional regulator
MEHLTRDQIANVAQLLLRLSDIDNPALDVTEPLAARGTTKPVCSQRAALLEQVSCEQRNRKRRTALIAPGGGLFADPAWDILLELYVAELRGQKLNASVLGIEAGIPQSTALRWLALLEKMGLARRSQDVFDKRRQWVALTRRATAGLEHYFA